MLGQLIADVTGSPYPDAATSMVLEPRAVTGSSFPGRWPQTRGVHGCAGDPRVTLTSRFTFPNSGQRGLGVGKPGKPGFQLTIVTV